MKASNSVDKGFHVHANGDLTNKCSDAGGHFNPKNVKHGKPSDSVQNRHVGDLGNVQVRNDGSVSQTITDNLANLIGSDNIIGKAIVVSYLIFLLVKNVYLNYFKNSYTKTRMI